MLPVAKPLDFQNNCWDNCLMFTALGSGALSLPEQNASFFQFKPEVTGGPWGLGPATPLDIVHWKSHPSGKPLRSILWVQSGHCSCFHIVHLPTYTYLVTHIHRRPWLQIPVHITNSLSMQQMLAGPESENGPVHSGHHCGVGTASSFNLRKSGFESNLSQQAVWLLETYLTSLNAISLSCKIETCSIFP